MTEATDDDVRASTGDLTTDDTDVRHPYTNDSLAWFVIGATIPLYALSATAYLDLTVVPQPAMWAWIAVFLTAAGWVFGKDLIESVYGER